MCASKARSPLWKCTSLLAYNRLRRRNPFVSSSVLRHRRYGAVVEPRSDGTVRHSHVGEVVRRPPLGLGDPRGSILGVIYVAGFNPAGVVSETVDATEMRRRPLCTMV